MKAFFNIFFLYIILLALAFSNFVEAQNATFRKSLIELRAGGGGSFFFGDLGGNFTKRKDAFLDLDPQTVRYNINAGIKYNFTKWFAVRSDINIAKLVADDARAADGFRKDRNLSFQSNITEATLMAELVMVNFLKLKRLAKLHTELYVFTGIGAFTYNPQAKYEGVWYDLRPLGTEGQGLIPGTKEYGQIAGVIPMGFGIRKLLTSSLTLGMEMSFRKSFTDYIDDVSGRYYSQDQLRERRGQIAAELSDRRIGSSGSVGFRGNPNENDNYGFFQIYIYKGLSSQLILNEQQAFRKVSKKMYKCPKFL